MGFGRHKHAKSIAEKCWEARPDLREEVFSYAIDVWGESLLDRLEEPVPPAVQAEVAIFQWVWQRRKWIARLGFAEMDDYIRRECPDARVLPRIWSMKLYLLPAVRIYALAGSAGGD